MAYINWDESLSVNIASIDEQHKKLINLINEFYQKINEKSNNELISGLINEMREYIILHFTTEEELFKKYNYPGFENHKKEHDKFVSKVNDLQDRFNNNKVILTYEITSFIKDWIKNHIQGTDKEYSSFLNMHGVK